MNRREDGIHDQRMGRASTIFAPHPLHPQNTNADLAPTCDNF